MNTDLTVQIFTASRCLGLVGVRVRVVIGNQVGDRDCLRRCCMTRMGPVGTALQTLILFPPGLTVRLVFCIVIPQIRIAVARDCRTYVAHYALDS